MEKTLSANADEPATPAEFGRALHAVQDSYRHRAFGYTGSFAVWGIEQYDEGLRMYGGILDEEGMRNAAQWGHIGTTIAALWRKKILKETGVTSPDDPLKESHWPDLDAAMTAETQRLLEDYLREYIAWYLQQQTQSEQNSEPYE